jgi:hypothetical protein
MFAVGRAMICVPVTNEFFFVPYRIIVPEYEVVSIRSLQKRSLDEKRLVSFNAFGKDMRLSLQRNPHLVKQGSLRMWIAEPDSTAGVHYEELPQVISAAVTIKNGNGTWLTVMVMIIGDGRRILLSNYVILMSENS